MLPILCAMDLVGIWAYRGTWDRDNMRIMVPGAIVGIVLGTLTFRHVNDDLLRLILGLIAVFFALNHWFGHLIFRTYPDAPAPRSAAKGGLCSAVAGYTSFIAHAGGPPASMYPLPQHMDKALLVGTTVVLFLSINYLKLFPYWLIGQFSTDNTMTSLVLLPLAPVGMMAGVWLHRRVSQVLFYRICYGLVFVIDLKLLFDAQSAYFA